MVTFAFIWIVCIFLMGCPVMKKFLFMHPIEYANKELIKTMKADLWLLDLMTKVVAVIYFVMGSAALTIIFQNLR